MAYSWQFSLFGIDDAGVPSQIQEQENRCKRRPALKPPSKFPIFEIKLTQKNHCLIHYKNLLDVHKHSGAYFS